MVRYCDGHWTARHHVGNRVLEVSARDIGSQSGIVDLAFIATTCTPFERQAMPSMPGVFAVGDVRADSIKRVAPGIGGGSIGIRHIHDYLATLIRREVVPF